MELNSLPKTTKTKLRRLGQGHGSGRGKTAGRGTKGQKARGKIRASFEGGALPLVKRMPFLRGRGRNKIVKAKTVSLSVSSLNKLPSKSTVDVETLIKAGLVEASAKKTGVKIIGNKELKIALTIKLPVTAGAKKQIERAGGTVAA